MLERAVSFVRNGAMMRNTDERAMPEDDGRINGVNLGGWLVLERWMTPGLFRASGEEDEIWLVCVQLVVAGLVTMIFRV